MIPQQFAIGFPPHLALTRVGAIWLWRIAGGQLVCIGRLWHWQSRRSVRAAITKSRQAMSGANQ